MDIRISNVTKGNCANLKWHKQDIGNVNAMRHHIALEYSQFIQSISGHIICTLTQTIEQFNI